MELTMAGQRDATPWEKPQAVGPDGLLGRGNFDQLGIVRRKPSRPDAPASLSKSCTDKLALKQCTSLLSGLVSLLVHPKNVYLSSLVLPHSQYVEGAVHRAFSAKGRMEPLVRQESLKWTGSGYKFTPFTVRTTSKEFTFSKRAGGGEHGTVSSNLSAVYTPRRQEVLINGMLQGRKAVDPRGASCVSRRVMWASVLELAVRLGIPALVAALEKATYAEVKAAERLGGRELVKSLARDEALQGWRRNDGDDDWSL
jgi:tRNA-specific adenosine deaminase 1